MTARKFFTHPLGIIGSAIIATALWGSAFPFIKLGYQHLGIEQYEIGKQILFAGYRFFLASCMIFVLFLFLGKDMSLKKQHIPTLAKVGLFQTFLQYVLSYIGLSYSTGIQGSIIAGTVSFFQIVFAHFMYKDDSLSRQKAVGLAIGFFGIVVVNLTKGSLQINIGIGEILLIIAMAVSGYGNLLSRNASMKMDVGYLTAYQMLIGSVGLLVVGASQVGLAPFSFTPTSLVILIYMSFVSSVGFLLWNSIMRYNKVGKVSMYLFLTPIFGVFLSSIFLKEQLHVIVFLGLALVVAGIIVVNRTPDVEKEAKKTAA